MSRREVPWAAVRSGVFFLLLLVLGATAVFFLDIVLREMSEGPELMIAAPEARNLEPGAEVWVDGVPAGRVLGVRFRERTGGEGPVLVRTVLQEEAAPLIRRDASATIHQSALMAPAVVAVRSGTDTAKIDYSEVLQADPLVGAEDVLARLDSLGSELRALRPLGRRLERRLEEGPGTLAALRSDTALQREMREMAERADALAEQIPSGSARRLADDDQMVETWARVADQARRLSRRARERAGPTAASLDSLAATAAGVARRLEEGRGSLARFLDDPAVAREARSMRARLDSVRATLLAEPLSWLRLRLF